MPRGRPRKALPPDEPADLIREELDELSDELEEISRETGPPLDKGGRTNSQTLSRYLKKNAKKYGERIHEIATNDDPQIAMHALKMALEYGVGKPSLKEGGGTSLTVNFNFPTLDELYQVHHYDPDVDGDNLAPMI